MQTLIPYLAAVDAAAAVQFYVDVFGAVERGPRLSAPDGKVMHTELTIGDSQLMLAEEMPDWGNLSPAQLGGTSVRLNVMVEDCDQAHDRAVAHGAKSLMAPEDQFYGHRSARVEDPFGHVWLISQLLREVSHQEMQEAWQKMLGGDG